MSKSKKSGVLQILLLVGSLSACSAQCCLSELNRINSQNQDGTAFSLTSMLGDNPIIEDLPNVAKIPDRLVIMDMLESKDNIPELVFGKKFRDEKPFQGNSKITRDNEIRSKCSPGLLGSVRLGALLRSSSCSNYASSESMRQLISFTDPIINSLQSDLEEISKHSLEALLDGIKALILIVKQSWIEFIMDSSHGLQADKLSLEPLFGSQISFQQCIDGWLRRIHVKLFGERDDPEPISSSSCRCRVCCSRLRNDKNEVINNLRKRIPPCDINGFELQDRGRAVEQSEKILKIFQPDTIKTMFDGYQDALIQLYKRYMKNSAAKGTLRPLYTFFTWMAVSDPTSALGEYDSYLQDDIGLFKSMEKWSNGDVKHLLLSLPVLREQWIELMFYIREQNIARCKLNLGFIKEKLSSLRVNADAVADDDLCYF